MDGIKGEKQQWEVINVAASTAADPLRWELDRYQKSHTSSSVARAAIPWNDVKEHLRKYFLHVDKQSALMEEVEQTKQMRMSWKQGIADGSGSGRRGISLRHQKWRSTVTAD